MLFMLYNVCMEWRTQIYLKVKYFQTVPGCCQGTWWEWWILSICISERILKLGTLPRRRSKKNGELLLTNYNPGRWVTFYFKTPCFLKVTMILNLLLFTTPMPIFRRFWLTWIYLMCSMESVSPLLCFGSRCGPKHLTCPAMCSISGRICLRDDPLERWRTAQPKVM